MSQEGQVVMRRMSRTLVVVILLGSVLAAAPAQGVSQFILGDVVDGSSGGAPFAAGSFIWVDAFDTTTRDRYSDFWTSDGATTSYVTDSSIPPGTYRVRVRVWNPAGDTLIRYQWYGGGTTYETGTDVVVAFGVDSTVDFSPTAYTAGSFSGTISPDAGTAPIDTCLSLMPVEATSGIGIGWVGGPDQFGEHASAPGLPAGTYRLMASWAETADPACDPAEYLSAWYGGGSFGPDAWTGSDMGRLPGFGLGSTIVVTAGSDTTGIDIALEPMPLCFGMQPTIVGTDLPETLTGTAGNDVIVGLDGNDVLYGLDGVDRLCGGDDRDSIFGGPGRDRIAGDAGRDSLYGAAGNDRILGGTGNDAIGGQGGDDKAYGGGGNDDVDGDAGDDLLRGQGGDDDLDGGPDSDDVAGGPGTDTCIGEVTAACEA